MPRKSTSTASREAATSSKVEKTEQDTPRRSGRAAAKVESSPNREAGRSRRSSTAAQTAASVAESRVTRSRTSVGIRKTSSSPSEGSSSKSGREVGIESPASRVRSSRRSTGRVNYKESDGEEESRTRKKLLPDEDENFDESDGEESLKGSTKRKTDSADKAAVLRGKAKTERVSSRRQSRSKNIEDKDEKEISEQKQKDSESLDDASSSLSARRSTRVRQSSGTPVNKGPRRSSRGAASQPVSAQRKRSSRGKSEPDAEIEVMDAEAEDSHSKEASEQDDNKTSDENLRKRKLDSDAEETAESEKRIKLDTDSDAEISVVNKIPQKDESDDSTVKSECDTVESKKEIDLIPEKQGEVVSENLDGAGDVKENISSQGKEQSDDEPMEVDDTDGPSFVTETHSDKQEASETPEVLESADMKSEVCTITESGTSELSKDQCSDESTEPTELVAPEPELQQKEKEPCKNKEEEVIDIASGSDESESAPSPAGKETKHFESNESSQSAVSKAETSPPVHDVDNGSEDSSSPTPVPSSECVERVPHIIDKTESMELDSAGPSVDASVCIEKDSGKNDEVLQSDRQPSFSESSQESSDRGNVTSNTGAGDAECINIQESNKSDSDVNCLESPETTSHPENQNSSNALLSSEQDKESSFNGVHSNSEDSIKSIEIVGDGKDIPFPTEKESAVEYPVPKANGAHDGIHDSGAAQDQSLLDSSTRRYVLNSTLKEDMSVLKDKAFEFASYNLHCIVEDGSSQKDELINELNKLKADVICLQEVTKHFYYDVLEPRLDALGYKGVLSVPEEQSLGIASFHKSAVFRLTRNSEASLQKLIEKDVEASSLESGDKAAVHSYLKQCGHVLFTQYSSIKGENTVTVANVSMPLSDISTHALQMSCLVREVITVIEGAAKPLLLCGTFNMAEGEAPYQLLRDGYLNNDMIEELQRKKDVVLPGKENAALVNLLWKAFQHPSSNLCSCYASVLGHELAIPAEAKSITSPDLLWFSSDCLHTVGVLDISPASFEGLKGHHVALKATVAFSN